MGLPLKDSSTKGTFNFVAQKPRPGVVYHCISVAPKGDCIRPSVRIPRDADQRSELMSITIPK